MPQSLIDVEIGLWLKPRPCAHGCLGGPNARVGVLEMSLPDAYGTWGDKLHVLVLPPAPEASLGFV